MHSFYAFIQFTMGIYRRRRAILELKWVTSSLNWLHTSGQEMRHFYYGCRLLKLLKVKNSANKDEINLLLL